MWFALPLPEMTVEPGFGLCAAPAALSLLAVCTGDIGGDLVAESGDLHAAWLARLDQLAVYLQYLHDHGVAVLFRPLHEMNQGAFWWGGRPGPDGTRRLYQITHDYPVGDKPMAMGECARLPTPAELSAQPRWVFFMAWAELVYSDNSDSEIIDLYSADRVVTRDELPGWL